MTIHLFYYKKIIYNSIISIFFRTLKHWLGYKGRNDRAIISEMSVLEIFLYQRGVMYGAGERKSIHLDNREWCKTGIQNLAGEKFQVKLSQLFWRWWRSETEKEERIFGDNDYKELFCLVHHFWLIKRDDLLGISSSFSWRTLRFGVKTMCAVNGGLLFFLLFF